MDIDIDDYSDLDVKLTKTKFNELCEELYAKTSKLIDDTLKMAILKTDDIDHVVNSHEKSFYFDRNYFFLNYLFRYWSVGQQGFLPLKIFWRENSEIRN